MPERASVNQQTQIGVESVNGTPVAASKRFQAFDLTLGIKTDTKDFRPMGRKLPSEVWENLEWTDLTLAGQMDYAHVVYPLASICGAATITNAGASVTAKNWTYDTPLSGVATPKSFSIEQGDSVRAHKVAYGLFVDFGYKLTRKEFHVSGGGIAQLTSDGIALTASPTAIPLQTALGKHVSMYMDPTSGALGTTQLLKVLEFSYEHKGTYAPFWPVNRSNTSWAAHVDMAPQVIAKMKVEADSVGMSLLGTLQAGSKQFLRVDAIGAVIDVSNSINAEFKHDMCVEVSSVAPWADKDGVYAIEWTFRIVEDTTWQHGSLFVATNLLTAL